MQWGDLDLETGSLWIHRTLARDEFERYYPKEGCKHGSNRRIDLTPDTLTALRRYRLAQHERRLAHADWQDYGLIFDRHDGHWFHASVVRTRFHRLCDRAGVPRIELKGLRHTAATIMVANGVPLHAVKQRLGHATIKMTAELYAHHTRQADQQTVETLSRALRNG